MSDPKYKVLPNGKLDDSDLKSEYERGYVDCWNENINLVGANGKVKSTPEGYVVELPILRGPPGMFRILGGAEK